MCKEIVDEPVEYPDGVERPRTRGDCIDGPRPCPFVSCKYHLYLDVDGKGRLKINHPGLDPDQIPETCALDVADRGGPDLSEYGGASLEEIGIALNLTRERVRQIEFNALRKKRKLVVKMGL